MVRVRQRALARAALLLCMLTPGCVTHHPLALRSRDVGPDRIQTLVEKRVDARSRPRSAEERWNAVQTETYQSRADLQHHRDAGGRAERERKADPLFSDNALSLTECLAFSLVGNDRIQASRAAIRGVKGDEWIAHSRFLPRLFYGLSESGEKVSGAASWDRERDQTFSVEQNLVEFGKHAAADVAVREAQRETLFAYEEEVRAVLSQVRIRFSTILLRKQQLAERRKLMREFVARREKIQKLLEAKRVPEVDLLTARLNVLNEEARINTLEREILRQKLELFRLAGFRLDRIDTPLAGTLQPFDLAPEEAIDIALRRSATVAATRAAVADQYRAARQTLWEFGPDLAFEAGRKTGDVRAGMRLTGEDGRYGLGAFGEKRIHSGPDPADETETRRYAEVLLELPVFDGLERWGRYKKARARLEKLRHDLRHTIDRIESDIRKAYETLRERRRELAILQEKVAISRERLRIKHRLKELGRITDNELETFRSQFFNDQDAAFRQEIDVIESRERIRFLMRTFEPLAPDETEEAP